MAYRLVENIEEVRETLSRSSVWPELSVPDSLTVSRIAFDKDRPALVFQVDCGTFSDPGIRYVLHIPPAKVEFSVYTNAFSSQYCDIEWYRSCPIHHSLESEINQAIYEAWWCFTAQWGRRHENPSMVVSYQGQYVKMVVS